MNPLLTPSERSRLLQLVQDQPGATAAFMDLLDTIKGRIVQAALGDPRVRTRLGEARHGVVDVDFREEADKARGALTIVRLAEVLIYDYDRNQLLVAVVDVRTGAVEDIEERPGIQPRAIPPEVDQARALVLSHDRFADLRSVPGLEVAAFPARVAFNTTHPRGGHRCFRLYFWTSGEASRRVGEAAVDLSTQELIDVQEADATDGQPSQPTPPVDD